jgi:branched-chain amino acid transport system permease protein
MDIVVMVILGGMGNTIGVCLAAVLLTVLPEVLRYVSHIEALPDWLQHIAENRMILYSLALIVLMLARPQGLWSARVRRTRARA